MNTGWSPIALGKHIRVKHGFAFQGRYFGNSGDYIVLTPGNFFDKGGFKSKSGSEKFYSANPPTKYVLRRDDLVLAMTEQARGLLGSSALIPCDDRYLHNQRIGLVEIMSDGIDKSFLYYLFNAPTVRDQIQATATGSKVRHTAPSRIESVIVPLPSLDIQRKIVTVLSAYDYLIESNRRRITILEEMAQRIYREWFVEFRYPDHGDAPMGDSELGPIPAGWTPATIGSCASFLSRGISPKYDKDAAAMVINQKCIRNGRLSMTKSRRHITNVPTEKRLQVGDVLINSTGVGTLGRVAQVLAPMPNATVDSHVSIVRPSTDTMTTAYWGLSLIARQHAFESMGAGSTGQTELSRRRIADTALSVPPLALQIKFEDVVGPMRSMVPILEAQNRILEDSRDLLLPGLISGEIDVEDLDLVAGDLSA